MARAGAGTRPDGAAARRRAARAGLRGRRLRLRRRARGRDRLAPPARLARGGDGAQRGRAAGSTTSTRATACRSSSSRSTPSGWPSAPTSRSSPIRTAPRPRSSPSCAAAGCASSTCRPTSGCTISRCTSAGTGRTARPRCQAEAVFGLTELHRDEIARASLVANPGCYSTAAILALAPLARAGLIADAVVDAKSGVSGAGRGSRPTRRTSCPSTRT